MDIPHQLTSHLGELSDEPGADLEAMLAVLVDDLITAVPSFLGMTLTMPVDGGDVILHLLPPERAGAVGISLPLPLGALGNSDTGGAVVFYAAQPGAFVDIAADARFAFNTDVQVTLDEHLPSPDGPAASSGIVGHPGASTINQAVGLLLDRGHTPQGARDILRRRADQDGIPLHRVAQGNAGQPVRHRTRRPAWSTQLIPPAPVLANSSFNRPRLGTNQESAAPGPVDLLGSPLILIG